MWLVQWTSTKLTLFADDQVCDQRRWVSVFPPEHPVKYKHQRLISWMMSDDIFLKPPTRQTLVSLLLSGECRLTRGGSGRLRGHHVYDMTLNAKNALMQSEATLKSAATSVKRRCSVGVRNVQPPRIQRRRVQRTSKRLFERPQLWSGRIPPGSSSSCLPANFLLFTRAGMFLSARAIIGRQLRVMWYR